jgi:hypothetical protein
MLRFMLQCTRWDFGTKDPCGVEYAQYPLVEIADQWNEQGVLHYI